MKYLKMLGILGSMLIATVGMLYAGSMNLTTYYPAPNGNYQTVTSSKITVTPTSGLSTIIGDPGCLGKAYGGLGVQGTLSGCSDYSLAGDGSNLFINRPGTGNIYFREGNGVSPSQMTIISGGNVGIGTDSPVAPLDIGRPFNNTEVNGYMHLAGFTNPITTAQGAYIGWNALTQGTGETDFMNSYGLGSGGFVFMDGPSTVGGTRTTLMRIMGNNTTNGAQNGHVGIGTGTGNVLDPLSVGGGLGLYGDWPLISFNAYNTVSPNQWMYKLYNSSGLPAGTNLPASLIYQEESSGNESLRFLTASPGTGNIAFNTAMVISSASTSLGNVGIGTTAPLARLHVAAGGGFGQENAANGTLISSSVSLLASGNSTQIGIVNAENRPVFAINIDGDGGTASYRGVVDLYDKTSGSTWNMDISLNNGKVGIGTASPTSPLSVNGDTAISGKLGVVGMDPEGKPNGWGGGIHTYDGYAEGSWGVGSNNNGVYSVTAYISSAGTVWASGSNSSQSDGRLKTHIVPLVGALANLDRLRGVSFEWNHLSTTVGHKEGEQSIGMIAQELQKVYPELVVKDMTPQKYLAIDYGKFSVVLLQAVKELKAQVNTLQNQVHSLQAEVKTLKKK